MEDATPNKENLLENETANLRLSGTHDAQLPISVVGGLIGMLIGTLPAAIWVLIFGVTFSPLYVFLPLLIYWGIKFFKGYRGKRGFIIICFYSVIGFYLTILSCQAAIDVIKYKMLFTSLPLVTITMIGKIESLSGLKFSSAYVFPTLFVLLGAMLTLELLMHKNETAAAPERRHRKED